MIGQLAIEAHFANMRISDLVVQLIAKALKDAGVGACAFAGLCSAIKTMKTMTQIKGHQDQVSDRSARTMVARNQRMAGGQMMDAVVEYRNDQPDEENEENDPVVRELRGLREDLRFLRMLSIGHTRTIENMMQQFEPKPSALAKIARYSVAAALAVAALLVTIIGLAYGPL
jgi:hypothetical protein